MIDNDLNQEMNKLSSKLKSTRRNLSFFDKKKSQRMEDKKELKTIIRFSNTMINRLTSLKIAKVSLQANNPDNFDSGDFLLELDQEVPDNAQEFYKLMYWKEYNNISDKVYRALKQATLNLPTLYSAKNFRKKINDTFVVKENSKGVFVEIIRTIENLVTDMLSSSQIELNDKILIKLAGDGTNVGVRKLFNFTLSILNSDDCLAASGHHTLGVFEIKQEGFEDIDICLKEIIQEARNLKQIKLANGATFEVDLFLAGDLKFLAIAHGINCANANSPCIWCTISKNQYKSDIDKCSILDNTFKARNHSQFEVNGPHSGFLRKSLFDFIPFHKTIPDILHMFMRIAERLLKLLVDSANTTDQTSATGTNTHSLFLRLANRIQEITRLTKNVYYIENNKYNLINFSGDRLHLLFQKLDLEMLLPEINQIKETEIIWKTFYDLYMKIKRNQLSSNEIKERSLKWGKMFLAIYHLSDFTPYIHIFSSHLFEFVELHGDINKFNTQGLEKLNDLTTSQYFKGTSKHHGDYLAQLLRKRNRIQFLKLKLRKAEDSDESDEDIQDDTD